MQENQLKIIITLRSSDLKLEKFYLNNLFKLADDYGIAHKILSVAPFFEKKENSYLQKICKQTYESLYNKKAIVEGIHAGLEGGVFATKKTNLDICVLGANLIDIHSPSEKASISSVNRVYEWLKEIVKNF